MNSPTTETAILGGGCFWCLEAVYELVDGVLSVKSGYAGGARPDPTYEQVCTGATGHAEVVEIRFDPSRITYRELLQIFFSIHDPTTLNRQDHDVGTQYRSVIFYLSGDQKAAAESVMGELERAGLFSDPLVTVLAPLQNFYPAEDYHDSYYRRNLQQPYCQYVIDPKVAKFRLRYFDKLKTPDRA